MKPQLVMGEGNRVCVQLRLGPFTATVPLPDEMATYTEDQLRPFFDRIVPEMTKNLIAMRNDHARKLRKKAACRSGTTVSPRSSAERTLKALPKP